MAAPAADETTPSMPLAPRLARKRSGFDDVGKNASTSRTGIEELTQTRAWSGSADSSAARTLGSKGSGALASSGGTTASASSQDRSQSGSGSTARISSAAVSASQVGAAAAASTISAVRVGSCQAPWGSTSNWAELASQARSGAEVGVS